MKIWSNHFFPFPLYNLSVGSHWPEQNLKCLNLIALNDTYLSGLISWKFPCHVLAPLNCIQFSEYSSFCVLDTAQHLTKCLKYHLLYNLLYKTLQYLNLQDKYYFSVYYQSSYNSSMVTLVTLHLIMYVNTAINQLYLSLSLDSDILKDEVKFWVWSPVLSESLVFNNFSVKICRIN